MGTYHLIWVGYLIFIQIFHRRTFIHLGFHFFPYTFLTLNHKWFFHVSLLALHSTMFFHLLLGWLVMFGYNNHQTEQLVLIVVMVIYEIFECYCECWRWISRCYWGGSQWKIFLSIHNNQINAPINKYFYPSLVSCLCSLLLLFLSLFCLVSSFKCMGLDA